MTKKVIAIVGAGAAGFFSAIRAAEVNSNAEVAIFESSRSPLAKVLISGGGRCNVTNFILDPAELIKNYPRGNKELRGPFSIFNVNDTIAWFESHGVKLKAEADGRMFPITDNSETIADCLLNLAKKMGIKLHLHCRVNAIQKETAEIPSNFTLRLSTGEDIKTSSIILTTGGTKSSYELARSLGHKIESPVPSLFSFEIKNAHLDGLQGVSFPDVALKMKFPNGKTFHQIGPILITHWGLSGPATIKLSALAARELFETNYNAPLFVNLLKDLNQEQAFAILKKHKANYPKRLLQSDAVFNLPKSYWLRILEIYELEPRQLWAEVSDKILRKISEDLTNLRLEVLAKGKFKDEFVTCGGVSLKEVNFSTMESRLCQGLFFAGEVLDIDGITGGFNFQNAWTTGWIAGSSQEFLA